MAGQKSILVVDDDRVILTLVSGLLTPQGWDVDTAADGSGGLARLEARPYDIVLADILLPDIDGLELARRARQRRPECRVFVMTAASTPERVLDALREQVFGYFSKPFAPGAIIELLEHALHSPGWEDDIELLSAVPHWIAFRVRCKIEAANRVVHMLQELETELPLAEREEIATAFREMLMNAIEHGGRSDPEEKVYVACLRTPLALLYFIRDPGDGFSFEDLSHAAISNPDGGVLGHLEVREQRGIRAGGFGLLLARSMVDELIHNEKGNEVLLVKYRRK